jgi:succinate dehydrogenase / fumarate reductase membrane anchor subunit
MSLSPVAHWKVLRITAILSLPLCLWFVYSIVQLAGAPYIDAVTWLQSPVNAVLMILFVIVNFYHAMLGIHEILEDYVHAPGALKTSMTLKCLAFVVVGAICIYSIVKVAFL